MTRFLQSIGLVLLTLGGTFGGAAVRAEIVTFTLDPLRSSLTSEAIFWELGGVPLIAQDAPANTSLTSSYTGSIQLEVDDPLNPTTFQFLSADALAMNNGEWLPAPDGGTDGDPDLNGDGDPGLPAPAQFGYQLDEGPGVAGFFAFRDTVLTLESDELFYNSTHGYPTIVNLRVTQGSYDYNVSTVPFGDFAGVDDVTDETAENFGENGRYTVDGQQATLTLPIDASFGGRDADIEVIFRGEFVAVANFGMSIEGDYNDNGRVEQADLDLVLLNWNEPVANLPATWINERPTTGIVDQAELDGVLLNWNRTSALGTAAAVPEPNTLILLLLAPTPLIARLRW